MKFDPTIARRLLLRGHSISAIAKRFRLTAQETYSTFANSGMSVRELKETRKEAMRHDLEDGMPVEKVMEKYGANSGYVNNVRRELERVEKKS